LNFDEEQVLVIISPVSHADTTQTTMHPKPEEKKQ